MGSSESYFTTTTVFWKSVWFGCDMCVRGKNKNHSAWIALSSVKEKPTALPTTPWISPCMIAENGDLTRSLQRHENPEILLR